MTQAVTAELRNCGTAEQCAGLIPGGKTDKALQILGDHRKYLLEEVRINKKRIDWLDYFIYRIERADI